MEAGQLPEPAEPQSFNGTTTHRPTYSLAGQAIAVPVQVVGGSNTVYCLCLYSDHLRRRLVSASCRHAPGSAP